MSYATLIDTTKCIGCRSCQVTCKQWNDLSGEQTRLQGSLGLQNPVTLSANTFTLVTCAEIADEGAPGGVRYVFTKRQCMHCDEPACVSACPATALRKTASGAVVYDAGKCIGCRYCMLACPFGAPTAEWDSLAPKIRKCTLCQDRLIQPVPTERDGRELTEKERKRFSETEAIPACVKQCPAGALEFGTRDELLSRARTRIRENRHKYVDRIYGEKEAGGTSMLYLAGVPFDRIGFREVGFQSYPRRTITALETVPPGVIAVGAALGGTYALRRRSEEVEKKEKSSSLPHHDFARIERKLWTPLNVSLALIAALGAICFILRFALGLGGSTHLSDTYAWGIWIVLDLVWIAVSAGAFSAAALIYIFQRKDLYPVGRMAISIGLLSYSFVALTLLADLGQPWHFWQLALQFPQHSAMYEVSWCVALYVTVLILEFLPVPLEHWRLSGVLEKWNRWSPLYVVAAVTTFVWLLSRNYKWTALACAVLGFLAWIFREKPGRRPEPVMLVIAGVAFSTMHQSSLGSLFLLMPDKLDVRWWSPLMPIEFFVSSIAAGTALLILVEIAIARMWERSLNIPQLAAIGKVVLGALFTYEVIRVGDLAVRDSRAALVLEPKAWLLVAELLIGGLIPLALLASGRQRTRPGALGLAAALVIGGVALNRTNVVLLGMNLKGPIPQIAPAAYWPSIVEWGISAGAIAGMIFLFGLAARHLPLLPKKA